MKGGGAFENLFSGTSHLIFKSKHIPCSNFFFFRNYTQELYTNFQKLLIYLCSIARVTKLLLVLYNIIAKLVPFSNVPRNSQVCKEADHCYPSCNFAGLPDFDNYMLPRLSRRNKHQREDATTTLHMCNCFWKEGTTLNNTLKILLI